jgi:hypothetical protein
VKYVSLPFGANMNDPGLHESAQEAEQDIEKNDDEAEQEEKEFLDPRYVSPSIKTHAIAS